MAAANFGYSETAQNVQIESAGVRLLAGFACLELTYALVDLEPLGFDCLDEQKEQMPVSLQGGYHWKRPSKSGFD